MHDVIEEGEMRMRRVSHHDGGGGEGGSAGWRGIGD
jgi:hypothetical protein